MTATTVKSRGKRLERSVQSRVDHTKIRINSAAEARNHAQFARDMPQPRTAGTKSLIGAQSGVSLRMMAFYLGNVGLYCS
jgi:hypothetical protein